MQREELTAWAEQNGWRMVAGFLSLTKPSAPKEAIVRLVFKTTVVNLEVKKPAGKWEKIAGAPYGGITMAPDMDRPTGLDFEKIPSFAMLMRQNKDQQTFAKFKA